MHIFYVLTESAVRWHELMLLFSTFIKIIYHISNNSYLFYHGNVELFDERCCKISFLFSKLLVKNYKLVFIQMPAPLFIDMVFKATHSIYLNIFVSGLYIFTLISPVHCWCCVYRTNAYITIIMGQSNFRRNKKVMKKILFQLEKSVNII